MNWLQIVVIFSITVAGIMALLGACFSSIALMFIATLLVVFGAILAVVGISKDFL